MKETVEEAAEMYSKRSSHEVFQENHKIDFINGAKSDAAKEYWFSVFKEQSEQDNWISVEERLPEDSKQVLMYTKYNATMYGFYSEGIWYETYNGMVCLNVHKVVTHWQPLPPPPKVKETEK